jgi:N6-adenosine-specific RNA methylase IME4
LDGNAAQAETLREWTNQEVTNMGNSVVKITDNMPAPMTAQSFYLLPEGIPREDFVALAKRLVAAEKHIQWALGNLWIYGERNYGDGQRLADEIGVNYKTVRNLAAVVRRFELSRRRDNLSFSHHEAVAALPAPEQDEWLDRAERDDLSVTKLRQAVKVQFMKDRRASRELEMAEGSKAASKALGKKLYGVIYADPPWRYDTVPMGDVARQNEQHYPTMALADIKAIKVPAADDCVLFLWATVPLLPEAIEVMKAWGFTYKSSSTWLKDKAGLGYWVRGVVEHLLIGRRGDVPAPSPGDQFPGFMAAPRGRHSEKPECFAEEIEALFPNVPKLEMFAREVRVGWDAWGNEVGYAVEVTPNTAPSMKDVVQNTFLPQARKRQKAHRMGRALKWRASQK